MRANDSTDIRFPDTWEQHAVEVPKDDPEALSEAVNRGFADLLDRAEDSGGSGSGKYENIKDRVNTSRKRHFERHLHHGYAHRGSH